MKPSAEDQYPWKPKPWYTRSFGYQVAVGFIAPSVTFQFTPLYWQLAVSWTGHGFCVAVGPLAVGFDFFSFRFDVKAGPFGYLPWRKGKFFENDLRIPKDKRISG